MDTLQTCIAACDSTHNMTPVMSINNGSCDMAIHVVILALFFVNFREKQNNDWLIRFPLSFYVNL